MLLINAGFVLGKVADDDCHNNEARKIISYFMKVSISFLVIVSLSAFGLGLYGNQLLPESTGPALCHTPYKQNFSMAENLPSSTSKSSSSSLTQKVQVELSRSSESVAHSSSIGNQSLVNVGRLAKFLSMFERMSSASIEDMYGRVERKFNEDAQDSSADYRRVEKEVERIVDENNLIPPIDVICKATICKLVFASSDATALSSVSESFGKSNSAIFHESLFDSVNGKLVVYLNKLDNESMITPKEDK